MKIQALTLILISIMVLSFVGPLTSLVKATATYEWLQNPSFEDGIGTEMILNGNFNSGALSDGWTSTYFLVASTYYHSSIYSAHATHQNQILWYNFSTPISVGSVSSFGCWYRGLGGVNKSPVRIYYDDNGYDSFYLDSDVGIPNSTIWKAYDFKALSSGFPNGNGKNIVALWVSSGATDSTNYNFDDFSLQTYVIGQTDITDVSAPWHNINGDSINGGLNGGVISTTIVHSGNYSFRGTYSWTYADMVFQEVNYLSSDSVISLTLWACLGVDTTRSLYMYVYYSDGTYASARQIFASYVQWTKLDFSSAIVSGKLIIAIAFAIVGESSGLVYIDDVSLLASVPYSSKFFEWFVSPPPLMATFNNVSNVAYTKNAFIQTMGVTELFTGWVYDSNGSKTENGTFSVYASATHTSAIGNVSSGVFSFTISARAFAVNTTETFTIDVTLTLRTFRVVISATWVYSTVIPIPTSYSGGDYGTITSNWANIFLPVIIFLGFPVLFVVLLGGLGGALIGLGCAAVINVILEPAYFWVLIVICIICLALLFGPKLISRS